jgi:hypothetical protein
MSKKTLIIMVGTVAILVSVMFVMKNGDTTATKPISQLVAEMGTPTFLAKWVEVDKTDLKVLRVLVLPQDPQTVTNWNSITDAILVWAESEPGRRNARYFYDEMKNDKTFDGKGWYSTRSLFGGEKVTIAKAHAAGNASLQKTFKVDAFSMQLMGFAARKPPIGQQQ